MTTITNDLQSYQIAKIFQVDLSLGQNCPFQNEEGNIPLPLGRSPVSTADLFYHLNKPSFTALEIR